MSNTPIDDLLVRFLAGDVQARTTLPSLISATLRAHARRLSPADFSRRGLLDDVVSHTWELLMQRPAGAFEPARASAETYLATIVRTAVRDIRSQSGYEVGPRRRYAERCDTDSPSRVSIRECHLQSPVDLDDTMTRLLGHNTDLLRAARMIAFHHATGTTAARVVGITRFTLVRKLRARFPRELLVAA